MRTELLSLTALTTGVLLSGCGAQEANLSKKQPNILFCIADDAGFPHFGAYGTKWVNTPAFDRVANEGILFNKAYTCNAKSSPSRAAIITGRNSWQLEDACNHWAYFPQKFKSFMEVLGEQGYYVGFTGKGFEPGDVTDANGVKRELTGKNWSEKTLTPPTKGIFANDYSANFKEFFKNRPADQPFTFWCGTYEPHRSYEFDSSKRFGKKLSEVDDSEIPDYWPKNDVVRRDLLDYAVEIEHYDYHIAEILKTLEEAGELDNTIVIITSDHGMPFPRGKGQAYEQSNHIPMAMMWKDGLKDGGREFNEYVSVIDIAPTLLEIAGIDQTQAGMQPITGRSLLDIINNEEDLEDRDFVLVGKERHDVGRPDDQGYPIRGLYRGDYLYIKNYEIDRWPAGNPETGYLNIDAGATKTEVLKARRDPKTAIFWELACGKRGEEELYNIATDPYCMTNLVQDDNYSELRAKMEQEMEQRLKDEGDPRMFGQGDIFDEYVYAQPLERDVWNRMKNGEEVRCGWVLKSDYEPGASGLEVSWKK